MPVLRYFSSIAQPTTLTSNINAGVTSIAVGSVTGFPTSYPYTLAVDWGAGTEELVDVTSAAGTTLTVVRGVDGTSAQSHGTGAAVRHVVSGRDFSDYQNHQAATSAVHGVTGTLVGTSDTQTLSNKTLSAPTISGGGSITGTFTGSPTFSGSVTLSGGGSISGTWGGSPTFTAFHLHQNSVQVQRSNPTDLAYSATVTGDGQGRFNIDSAGTMTWGDGTATRDTTLYRSAASVLATDDTFRIIRPASTDSSLALRVTGDTQSRFLQLASGQMSWGPGGAASQDANLYRSAAGTLKTDTSFETGAYMFPGQSIALAGTPTAASGWTLTQAAGFKSGGVTTFYVILGRTGADITANSAGNVTDQDLVTVPGDWRPPAALVGTAFMPAAFAATLTGGTCGLNSSGVVRLFDMHANSTIATGEALRFYFSFVNVDDVP